VFIDSLLGEVRARSLTVAALRSITGLDLQEVQDRRHIPAGPGVYVWAAGVHCGVWYVGSGSGWNGLWSRLGTWFRHLETIYERNIGPDPLAEDGAAFWVPAIRTAYLEELKCYASVVDEGSAHSAKEWEARIQQANQIASGNVSVLGGSAWENKAGSLAQMAETWAWERLREMERQAAAPTP
jgi:hypothetical protein